MPGGVLHSRSKVLLRLLVDMEAKLFLHFPFLPGAKKEAEESLPGLRDDPHVLPSAQFRIPFTALEDLSHWALSFVSCPSPARVNS